MRNLRWFSIIQLIVFFIIIQVINAQESKSATKDDENKLSVNFFKVLNKDSIIIQKDFPVLPINISIVGDNVETVSIDLIKLVSTANNIVPLKYKIEPHKINIFPDKLGKVFNIYFDVAEFKHIEPGIYTAYISIFTLNKNPRNEKLMIEIRDAGEFFSSFTDLIQDVRDNFVGLIWKIFEILFFVLVVGIVIWFTRLAIKGKNSLNVLSIVNETGSSGEFEGVASGIDDILITNLQEIAQKSRVSQIKHYWLSSHNETIESEKEFITEAKAQIMNVQGGAPTFGLQKIGDISVGPVKIPLGEITAFITKIFGGNYVSGALQKYGNINKIVLRLEKKPSIFNLKLDICYFEVTWPSEIVKIENLSEGVPAVIEELAYRITLNIGNEAGTDNWRAYKYFLEGILAFNKFEANRTRKDFLKDAINHWRESVRFDPNFAKAHYNLGVALDMDQKFEEALFRYQKVIQMSPELVGAEAHYNIAKLYRDIYKDQEKTIEELHKAKEIDPDLSDIYNLLGLVYSGKYEDQKAFEMYEEAIRRVIGEANPTYYYNQCVAKYHLKDYKTAKSIGQKVLDLYGLKERDKAILQTMGMIHIKLNEYKKALTFFEEGLMKDPRNRDMLHGYGVALEACDELDHALIIFRRLTRLWPEFGEGYIEIAKILKKNNTNQEEILAYEQAGQALNSENMWSNINKGNFQGFSEKFIKNTNLKKSHILQKKIHTGILASIAYYYFEDDIEAVRVFEEIFNTDSISVQYVLNTEFLHNYGLALFALGGKEEQKLGSTGSSDLFKKSIEALNTVITLYSTEQVYDLAECRSNLAEAFIKDKQFQNADSEFKLAIELYKQIGLINIVSDLHVKDANCLIDGYLAGKGNATLYDLARQECNYAIQYNNSNYSAFHVKGNTFFDFKQYADAIPEYEKAIEINFNLPGALYNLGLCYYYMGQFEEAAEKFETTIKLDEFYADPANFNNPDPYKRLSSCYEKLGKPEKAVAVLRRISDMYPQSAKYNLLLGKYLVKTKQLDEASRQFIDCLDFDPENKQGLKHLALNSLADLYADQGADIDLAYTMSRSALVMFKTQYSINNKTRQQVNYQLMTDRDLSSIRNTIGWILYQKGRVAKAVLFLEKSLMHALGEIKAHARLALAYEKFAQICSESSVSDFVEKAGNQWNIVLSLDCDAEQNKMAMEHLEFLKK